MGRPGKNATVLVVSIHFIKRFTNHWYENSVFGCQSKMRKEAKCVCVSVVSDDDDDDLMLFTVNDIRCL